MSVTFTHDSVLLQISYCVWGMIPAETRKILVRNGVKRPMFFPSSLEFWLSMSNYATLMEGMSNILGLEPAELAKFWAFAVNHDFDAAQLERDSYRGSNAARSVA